jgi:AraC family transcriptional regulator, transcriptional activator of the genes for pyochelin and ferripyochelin receptors
MNVTEAAYHIGYNNLSSFSYAFKKMFGYSPGCI